MTFLPASFRLLQQEKRHLHENGPYTLIQCLTASWISQAAVHETPLAVACGSSLYDLESYVHHRVDPFSFEPRQ